MKDFIDNYSIKNKDIESKLNEKIDYLINYEYILFGDKY